MEKHIKSLLKDIKDLNNWKDMSQLWMEKVHLTYPFPILQSSLDCLQDALPDIQGRAWDQ